MFSAHPLHRTATIPSRSADEWLLLSELPLPPTTFEIENLEDGVDGKQRTNDRQRTNERTNVPSGYFVG